MKGLYKISAATPRLHLGDTAANVEEMARLARKAAESGVAAIVFPELCVTGYTCGDLFFRDEFLDTAEKALADFANATADLPTVSIVGFPEKSGPAIYNSTAVVFAGKVAGVVRKRCLPTYREYYEARQFTPAPRGEPPKVFKVGGLCFCVEICEDLWAAVPPSSLAAANGVDIVFNLSASTDYLGKSARRREMVRQQSQRLGCAYAMACAGIGESSSDAVFGGDSMIAVAGRIAADSGLFAGESSRVDAVVDVDALRYRRRSATSMAAAEKVAEIVTIDAKLPEAEPSEISRSPFLDEFGEPNWHRDILAIQAAALARRMESAHSEKLVVGVSGGADSALALLGAAAAIDRLSFPRENLIAVVMPGFGSTGHTQSTAAELGRAVGATCRVIDICESCKRHLADIGHDEATHDIAYENVQARMRTMVLMDIANMERALVVGTGDLSEIALGWNTYNGDHMSMYQLNCSVPKTMVLGALKLVAEESAEPLQSILNGIANAPITPELVPGAAANDSEARLGPYELHDFFLFHYLAKGADADKLLALACTAFKGIYPDETVAKALQTFLRRFRQAQYKRNCVPDGPKITFSLSPRADWRMPSDIVQSQDL
ncbi:MAG: NAD(+) synthase [Kiritimatiellae bacterium]|nr:NAD(+) synthase [Kiritimatiellia bacterium]